MSANRNMRGARRSILEHPLGRLGCLFRPEVVGPALLRPRTTPCERHHSTRVKPSRGCHGVDLRPSLTKQIMTGGVQQAIVNTSRLCSQAYESGERRAQRERQPDHGEVIAARFNRRDIPRGALAATAISATVSPLALAAAGKARPRRDVRLNFKEVAAVDEKHYPGGLRRRHPHPLGRRGREGCSRLRSDEADRRGPGQAVRLQQRLCRVCADAGRRQPERARPPGREPRIHPAKSSCSRD